MQIVGPVRAGARAAAFAAWTASVVYAHRAVALVRPAIDCPEGKRPFIERWGRGVFALFGVEARIVAGSVPRGGPYLVVANHRAAFDILLCMHLFGGVVLSHHGVASWPIFGTAARATDTIFVDRSDPKSGARAIRAMRSRLREGRNVIVFPEGTTFRGDEVRPFKRGAFSAARGLRDVEVLPVGLAYPPGYEFVGESFGQHLARTSARAHTPIWVAMGTPTAVPRDGEGEEDVRRALQSLVDRAARARDVA